MAYPNFPKVGASAAPLLAGGPAGIAYGGISFGTNILSRIFETKSQRARLEKLREMMLANLRPYEARVQGYSFAPTSPEGFQMGRAAETAQEVVASQGVGGGSFTGPAVAAAVAPVQAQREQNLIRNAFDLAQAKNAIYAATQAPGYGEAFGGFLGDVSDFASNEFGNLQMRSEIERLLKQFPDLAPMLGYYLGAQGVG